MNLKTTKLYSQVDRIHNELRALGLDGKAPLKVSDLTPFDHYHYFGTEAVDEAARALGVTNDSRVLEVGAGIGGPARYLAATMGCRVVALEIQRDPARDRRGVDATMRTRPRRTARLRRCARRAAGPAAV